MSKIGSLARFAVISLALLIGSACDQQRLAYNQAMALYYRQDFVAAAAQFTVLAQQQYAPAEFRLGLMEFYGLGLKKQPDSALNRFHHLATQGYWSASYFLAHCYRDGVEVEKDETAAFRFYLQSAQRGFAPAQYQVALMQAQGEGVDANTQQAILWLQKAARGNHRQAQQKLITIYAVGLWGLPKDDDQTQYWRSRLAGRR